MKVSNSEDTFNWQAAQEHDMRLAELHFAKKLAGGMTTRDDAVEYLVTHGWTKKEAMNALGVKE